MVPVIMREQEKVDGRKIICSIDIAAGKRLVDEKERRSVGAEHRIDEDAMPGEVQIKGRMPHPDDDVLLKRQGFQVRFPRQHRLLRDESRLIAEEEFPGRRQAAFAVLAGFHDVVDGFEALEPSVLIVRRGHDALQPRSCELSAKLWARKNPL